MPPPRPECSRAVFTWVAFEMEEPPVCRDGGDPRNCAACSGPESLSRVALVAYDVPTAKTFASAFRITGRSVRVLVNGAQRAATAR
jgi:hypothetical protein